MKVLNTLKAMMAPVADEDVIRKLEYDVHTNLINTKLTFSSSEIICDGIKTDFTIYHNFDINTVGVFIYDKITKQQLFCDIYNDFLVQGQVTLHFSTPPIINTILLVVIHGKAQDTILARARHTINLNRSTYGAINYNTSTNIGSLTGYYGGILIPDGRVLALPNIATQFALIDPTDNSIVKFGTSISGCTNGLLLNTGNVLVFSSGIMYLVDPVNQIITPYSNIGSYIPIKLDNNTLLGLSEGQSNPRNISLNDYTTALDTNYPSYAMEYTNSGFLMDNGSILGIPNGNPPNSKSYFKVIDPIAKTITPFGNIYNYSSSGNWCGGEITTEPNTYILYPGSAPQFMKTNGETKTQTMIGPSSSSKVKTAYGCLLPDGRLFACRDFLASTNNVIFDPYDLTLTGDFTSVTSGTRQLDRGAVLLFDGRVMIIPFNNNQVRIYSASDGNYGYPFDKDVLLSPYLNKL